MPGGSKLLDRLPKEIVQLILTYCHLKSKIHIQYRSQRYISNVGLNQRYISKVDLKGTSDSRNNHTPLTVHSVSGEQRARMRLLLLLQTSGETKSTFPSFSISFHLLPSNFVGSVVLKERRAHSSVLDRFKNKLLQGHKHGRTFGQGDSASTLFLFTIR